MSSLTQFRHGTSSWSEAAWNGVFYPRGMKPGDYLAFYATQFTTVEADNTYYRVPGVPLQVVIVILMVLLGTLIQWKLTARRAPQTGPKSEASERPTHDD